MIKWNDITKAMVDQLNSNADVRNIPKNKIERGTYINENPNLAPWIGVYRGRIDYEPRTLGRHAASWNATLQLRIIVQAISLKTGEECEDLLEDYVKKIKDAVWSDSSVGGTVDMITGFTVDYGYNETERETMYFQTAIITVTMETATG